MKRTTIVLLLSSALFLGGCTSGSDGVTPSERSTSKSETKAEQSEEKAITQLLAQAKKQVVNDKLPEALELYDQALAKNPTIKSDIAENKAAVELLQQVQQLQKAQNYQQIKEVLADNSIRKNNDLVAHNQLNEIYQEVLRKIRSQESDPADKTTTKKTNNLWDAQKSLSLSQFMADWGTTMQQQYNELSPDKNGHFYGIDLPENLIDKIVLDGKKTKLTWRNQVTKKTTGASLVGMYSDAETAEPNAKQLYLFVIDDGKTGVYVTRQDQAQKSDQLKTIHFQQTKSKILKNGFENIVTGQSLAQPAAEKQTDQAELTSDKKTEIQAEFMNWADQKAQATDQAVAGSYFSHDPSSQPGDWYVKTPDGNAQVKDENLPGAAAFGVHIFGGGIFYTAKDGTRGSDSTVAEQATIEDYREYLDPTKPVEIYLLGDNAQVYTYRYLPSKGADPDIFGQMGSDGKAGTVTPTEQFSVSTDKSAQELLKNAIQKTSEK